MSWGNYWQLKLMDIKVAVLAVEAMIIQRIVLRRWRDGDRKPNG